MHIMHIVVAVLIVVLLALLTDPFMYWMPPMGWMATLVAAFVLLIVWSGFVMREKARDEREAQHVMHAGRVAYLAGIAVLTTALVVQGFQHTVDPWICAALAGMVLAKLVARAYLDRNG